MYFTAEIVLQYPQKEKIQNSSALNTHMDEIKYSTQNIDKQDIKIVTKTLRNDFITQGPLVSKFEKSLSDICQNKYIVALSNASNGLIVACKVLGLKK